VLATRSEVGARNGLKSLGRGSQAPSTRLPTGNAVGKRCSLDKRCSLLECVNATLGVGGFTGDRHTWVTFVLWNRTGVGVVLPDHGIAGDVITDAP